MTGDELTAPLGTPPAAAPARPPSRWAARLLAGAGILAGVVLAGAGAFITLRADPLGGEPVAVATIAPAAPATAPPATAPAAAQPAGVTAQPAAQAGPQTAGSVEAASGVTVVRGGSGTAPAAIIVRVPEAERTGPGAPDPSLLEPGHGRSPAAHRRRRPPARRGLCPGPPRRGTARASP